MTTETQRVLVTVSGIDAPGITSPLTEVVAKSHAALVDIEQVVVHGHLILAMLLDLSSERGRGVLKDLLFSANELGLEMRFTPMTDQPDRISAPRARYALNAVGDAIDADGVHAISEVLLEESANIESIRQLSEGQLASLEVVLSIPQGVTPLRLRAALVRRLSPLGIDLALQPETLLGRSKRLIVMDMDSTLITIEVIDELARLAGVGDEVARCTARAMAGELDYEDSLRTRVRLLKGLSLGAVVKVAETLPLTDGAEELVSVLQILGLKTGVISGGFSIAAENLKNRLGLDYAYSNRLDVRDGKLTGEVLEPIVTPQRKADLLETIAQGEGILIEQTIAVGDGANDLAMLERAGLGIAFHAKEKLVAAADSAVSRGGLDRILYLLGLPSREVAALLRRSKAIEV